MIFWKISSPGCGTSISISNRNRTSNNVVANAINTSFPAVVPSLLVMQDLHSSQAWQPFVFAYADAALDPDGPGSASRTAVLGLVVDLRSTILSCRLQVLGLARVESVVMAELAALLLAGKIFSILQVNAGGLGSDCLLAVRYLLKAPLQSPRQLRPWISQFQELRLQDEVQVIKISRSQNEAAHCLAVRARTVSSDRVLTSVCTNSYHDQDCPILSALHL